MKFTVVVYTAPYSSQAATTAWLFCDALLKSGHSIYRLFFYHDGVHNNSALAVPPQDEVNLPFEWQALISAHDIDAVSCVSSALKRGIVDAEAAHDLAAVVVDHDVGVRVVVGQALDVGRLGKVGGDRGGTELVGEGSQGGGTG